MKTRNILLLAVGTALMAGLASTAQAVDYKTYGACWAWNNNFNDPSGGIHDSFGTGSYPEESINFNFGSQSLYGYPAVCRGWHYGWSATGDNLFPLQLSKANNIPCSFSYQSGGSGMQGDFAYDTFLRWDNAKSSPQCEVMVWAGHNSFPIGNCTGYNVLNINNISWDIWEGYNSSAGYYVYTFVPDGSVVWPVNSLPTSGSLNVDLKPFYQWLNDNRGGSGYINNNMYLDVVECGFEVVNGNGWCYFNGWIDANTGSSGPSTGTYYYMQNRTSGLVIDSKGSTSAGSQVGQWSKANSSNLKWRLAASDSGYYYIQNQTTGLYLDGGGSTANGSAVKEWGYDSSANLQWKLVSSDSGNYYIQNRATGMYLDGGGATASGAALKQWSYANSSNLQWSFQ
jgi:hypothetical protein